MKCKNCDMGCAASETVVNSFICGKHNIGIYRSVPEGMRKATKDDLFNDYKLKLGIRHLLYSEYHEKYQVYKTSENTDVEMILSFVAAGRCYIKN